MERTAEGRSAFGSITIKSHVCKDHCYIMYYDWNFS